ncbi:DNA polymerase IV [Clostridium sediminicola]|uniref:DNA polymerase Y family protein n=1 Tax=Clostridium sediminicola TaxID=3114879 RepID=UPI0031F1F2E7
MENNLEKIIFHVDVNSAYLSWEAVNRLQHGTLEDLRTIPSAVGGDPKSRHGIILAKSIPAKKFGIKTGETLYAALKKCPSLRIVPPHYDLYIKCSTAMVNILKEYSPMVQRYSIDECFLDFTNLEKVFRKPVLDVAYEIKNRIKKELGFTVNIGISSNKLLAKMASDFKKPDNVHTLFKNEIPDKMWPLPVEELFMVGRATGPKLRKYNINTIGDLANYDVDLLKNKFKSFGLLLWKYANGIDDSFVRKSNYIEMKGLGNSTTIAFDVTDCRTAHMVILSLTETLGMRLRDSKNLCSLVSISIRNSEFQHYSHQKKLSYYTNSTKRIYSVAKELFDNVWRGEPIRHIGIRVSSLNTEQQVQVSFFDEVDVKKNIALDKAIDNIRLKYGKKAVVRSSFLHSGIKPINGGVQEEDYPIMSSIL